MPGEQGHILVVDDNRMNRLKLSLSLEQQGHTVGLAEDGVQGLDLARSGSFDVVLLDIVMPRMDGYKVLERMKSDPQMRDIPVIVISAVDEMESIVRCIEMGAEDFLPKSFDPVLLRARLNASLQKKRLRDLEKAYLQQELMLRQNEKLATLGRLSAGMAHELNNPASAAQRGAAQLEAAVARLQESQLLLGEAQLFDDRTGSLAALDRSVREKATRRQGLDPLELSDLEHDIEGWLDDREIEKGWEIAPALAGLGYTPDDLDSLAAGFLPEQLPALLKWMAASHSVYSLVDEIHEGASRVSEIIRALKSYTYMDQAPVQNVDLHEGLESTLVMLRSKWKAGITVHREYAAELPRIQAFGSQLNQVWTNLIDNAIDAMNGHGEITLRTRHEEPWAVVEIEDDGPGIPADIQSRIFDPFFTTKAPGEGTGMGLNIVHNIIVQTHKGKIDLESRPGRTRFVVKLPVGIQQKPE